MLNKNDDYSLDKMIDCCPFTVDLWINIQRHLIVADIIMKSIAKKYKMEFSSNSPYFDGGRWPERRLKKRKWFKIYQIQLLLNADYLKDNKIFYELRETCIVLVCLWGKTLWHKKVAEYTVDQMNNQDQISKDILEIVKGINSTVF